jgi:hypothetical protein
MGVRSSSRSRKNLSRRATGFSFPPFRLGKSARTGGNWVPVGIDLTGSNSTGGDGPAVLRPHQRDDFNRERREAPLLPRSIDRASTRASIGGDYEDIHSGPDRSAERLVQRSDPPPARAVLGPKPTGQSLLPNRIGLDPSAEGLGEFLEEPRRGQPDSHGFRDGESSTQEETVPFVKSIECAAQHGDPIPMHVASSISAGSRQPRGGSGRRSSRREGRSNSYASAASSPASIGTLCYRSRHPARRLCRKLCNDGGRRSSVRETDPRRGYGSSDPTGERITI